MLAQDHAWKLLIYFAGTRFLYSLFERREFKCIALEVIFSFFFLFSSVLLIDYSKAIISAGLVFITYMITAMLPYWIIRKTPVEASFLDIDDNKHPVVWLGIIDGAWLAIMGGACTFILIGQQIGIIDGPLPKIGYPADYYHTAIEECTFFLGISTNLFVGTGAALGGCMAILWVGELWRKKDKESRKQYQAQTLVSLKMVAAFFIASFAGIIWADIPLYIRMVQLKEFMHP